MTIPADNLRRFAADVFVAKGMRAEDARTVADMLVWADLRGVGTHGVSRIPLYCGYIDKGEMDPRGVPAVVTDLPASAKIDAHRAPGPVAMKQACALVMDKARAGGIGMVLVAHTTHTGALGCWAQSLAREGFASIAFTATIPFMAYHGAITAAAGTNPIAIGMPGSAGAEPIVLDMTTAAISMGQLNQARRTGRELPPGVAADANGQPVTDAKRAVNVLPLGGPKGAGLSLMMELLTSHIAGNPIIAEALESGDKHHRQNALVVAIDCRQFIDPALLSTMTQRLVDGIHGLAPLDAQQPVRLPGERGNEEAARRAKDGIAVPPPVLAELKALAQSLGLDAAPLLSP